VSAGDWPHWLGPNRNGHLAGDRPFEDLAQRRPKVLWKIPGGVGYSSVAVAAGRAITQVRTMAGVCPLLSMRPREQALGTKVAGEYLNTYGDGPRSTPTIEGKFRLTAIGTGTVDVPRGGKKERLSGRVNLFKKYGGKNLSWDRGVAAR